MLSFYVCSWNDSLQLNEKTQVCRDLLKSSPEDASEAFSGLMCYFTDDEYNIILKNFPIKKENNITFTLINCYIASVDEYPERYFCNVVLTDKFKIWTVIDSPEGLDDIFSSQEEKIKFLRK